MSEESEGVHSQREVWTATLATFASKLLTALTFAIPVLLLDLGLAVVVSVVWVPPRWVSSASTLPAGKAWIQSQ